MDWPDTGSTNKSQVLMRFDNLIGNALGQIPSNAIVTSASLFLNTNNTGDGALFYRMLQTWSDTTSTWNNWVGGVNTDGTEANTSPESVWGTLDVSGATGGGISGVSVTRDLRAWLNGASNYGWLLEPHVGGTDGWAFSPAETATVNLRPLLRVEWVPAGTKSVVFQQDLNGYSGTVDTNIASDLVTTQADTLNLGIDFEDASTARRQALLRFDDIIGNNPGQVPPGSTIHDAILSLATFGNNGAGDGGSFHRMNIDWNEDALWTTFTNGIQADGVEASTTSGFQAGNSSLDPDAQAGLVDFEVISDVQSWANGTPNYGWVGLPWNNGTNGWFFYSSENTFDEQYSPRPKLEIFYQEPVNASPTDILLSSSSLAENSGANATIGSLSTSDPNIGDTFTYALVSGTGDTDNGAFNILGNILRANSNLDFETKSSYSIRVRSTDQGLLSTEKVFIISATDLNELVSVSINGADTFLNSNQRSQLTSIVVVLDRPLVSPSSAFTLTNIGLLSASDTTLSSSQILVSSVGNVYTLRFASGPGVISRIGSGNRANSLADGNWRLTLSESEISGKNQFGTQAIDNFFRMYGDADGDGDVDGTDSVALRNAQLAGSYNAALDWDGNGSVTSGLDITNFSANLRKRRRLF